MRTRFYSTIPLSVYLLLVSTTCWSVDPFDNIAPPQASYFVAYPLCYGTGALNDHSRHKLTDPNVEIYETVLRYVHYDKKRLPHTWNFNAYLPVGCVNAFDQQDCGIGDMTLVAAYLANRRSRL
jgi:hypothetical protein